MRDMEERPPCIVDRIQEGNSQFARIVQKGARETGSRCAASLASGELRHQIKEGGSLLPAKRAVDVAQLLFDPVEVGHVLGCCLRMTASWAAYARPGPPRYSPAATGGALAGHLLFHAVGGIDPSVDILDHVEGVGHD